MNPIVSIIMGSTSDLPVLEAGIKFLDEMGIPFEMNALSAHRTPELVEEFARGAQARGIKVIIAAASVVLTLLPPGAELVLFGTDDTTFSHLLVVGYLCVREVFPSEYYVEAHQKDGNSYKYQSCNYYFHILLIPIFVSNVSASHSL